MFDAEALTEHLPLIERVIASICRRHGCSPDEAEDFDATVKLRLVEDDYAILRKFQGKSSLATYLTTVVHNLFRDYRIRKWGKWRPSVRARRLGTVAVRLDTLITRDGYELHEAVEVLKTSFGVEESREELEEIAAQLPQRTGRRFVGDEALENLQATDGVDRRVIDAEQRRRQERVERALGEAIAEFPGEERLMLKMRYEDGFTVAAIADALRVPARPLYSSFERYRRRLRKSLEARGVKREDVLELLDWERADLRIDYEARGERNPQPRSV